MYYMTNSNLQCGTNFFFFCRPKFLVKKEKAKKRNQSPSIPIPSFLEDEDNKIAKKRKKDTNDESTPLPEFLMPQNMKKN